MRTVDIIGRYMVNVEGSNVMCDVHAESIIQMTALLRPSMSAAEVWQICISEPSESFESTTCARLAPLDCLGRPKSAGGRCGYCLQHYSEVCPSLPECPHLGRTVPTDDQDANRADIPAFTIAGSVRIFMLCSSCSIQLFTSSSDNDSSSFPRASNALLRFSNQSGKPLRRAIAISESSMGAFMDLIVDAMCLMPVMKDRTDSSSDIVAV